MNNHRTSQFQHMTPHQMHDALERARQERSAVFHGLVQTIAHRLSRKQTNRTIGSQFSRG
jgi:hypothetical protein